MTKYYNYVRHEREGDNYLNFTNQTSIQKEAANENTLPDRLRELADYEDRIVRSNVAMNPNTPPEVLFELGTEFPQELLDNPVFSLLLLENLNFLEEIPFSTLKSLIKCQNPPRFLLEQTARSREREILLTLVINPTTPKDILEKLIPSQIPEVAEAATLHVNNSGEMTEGWEEIAITAFKKVIQQKQNKDFRYLEHLARLGLIPELVIEAIDSLEVYPYTFEQKISFLKQVIKHPNISDKILEKFVINPSADLRKVVANHPNTSKKMLEYLAKDGNSYVREAVASNPNISENILEYLVKDGNSYVREAVANNPSVSEKILALLVRDKKASVRKFVAINPHTPKHILKQLIKDDIVPVREKVAKNPNIPSSLLSHLAKDSQFRVRLKVAANLNASEGVLKHLARDNEDYDWEIRWALIQNPKTPTTILELLIEDLEKLVKNEGKIAEELTLSYYLFRLVIAQHPNIPDTIAQKLYGDNILEIVSTLEKFAYSAFSGTMYQSQTILGRWQETDFIKVLGSAVSDLNSSNYNSVDFIPEQAARNPQTPVDTLEQLVQHKHFEVRQNLAENPQTPACILEKLLDDRNQRVRQIAIKSYLSKNPQGRGLVLEKLIRDAESTFERIVLLFHSQVPTETLAKYYDDLLYWLERYAIATNTNTPTHIRERLTKDANRVVRAAAIACRAIKYTSK